MALKWPHLGGSVFWTFFIRALEVPFLIPPKRPKLVHWMVALGLSSAPASHPMSTLRRGSALQGGSWSTWPPLSGRRKSCLLHSGRSTIPFQHLPWPTGWRLVLPQLRRPHVHLDRADQACRLFHRRSPHLLPLGLVHSCISHLKVPPHIPFSPYTVHMLNCELAFSGSTSVLEAR